MHQQSLCFRFFFTITLWIGKHLVSAYFVYRTSEFVILLGMTARHKTVSNAGSHLQCTESTEEKCVDLLPLVIYQHALSILALASSFAQRSSSVNASLQNRYFLADEEKKTIRNNEETCLAVSTFLIPSSIVAWERPGGRALWKLLQAVKVPSQAVITLPEIQSRNDTCRTSGWRRLSDRKFCFLHQISGSIFLNGMWHAEALNALLIIWLSGNNKRTGVRFRSLLRKHV